MASQFECLPEPVIDAVFDLVAADERWAWSSTLQGRAKPLLLLSRFLYAFGQQAMLKDVCPSRQRRGRAQCHDRPQA